ncbi:MAG: glycosyltransferase family 39 protein, partial [Chloroflexi bacterium]|nr:glycosyltransferase family 39 protein [Chloroflexota bacterium]
MSFPRLVSLFSLLLLPVAVGLFLALTLRQLNLPGLYYDEALDLAPMLQVMHGEPTELLRGIGVTIGTYTYPVMLLDYMGNLNGYLTIPFMALFGPGVIAARLQPIVFSALTIVLAYALARAWFGRGVAAVTALLLAVNPSFIWFSRQGISVTSVMTVFSLGSLLLLDRWRAESRDWRLEMNGQSPISPGTPGRNLQSLISSSTLGRTLKLLFAGLLIGLGLWAKLLFLWWIVILGVMALVWVLTERGSKGAGGLLRALPWVMAGAVIGAAPLIYYNLHDLLGQPFDLRNAHTFALLFRSLGEPTA